MNTTVFLVAMEQTYPDFRFKLGHANKPQPVQPVNIGPLSFMLWDLQPTYFCVAEEVKGNRYVMVYGDDLQTVCKELKDQMKVYA